MVTWFCSRDLLDIIRQLQVQVWLHLKSKHVTPLIAWLSGAAKSRDLISWLPLAEAEAWDSTNYSAEIYDFKMENFKVWNWKFSFSWSGDPVKFKGKTGPDRIGSKSTGYRTGPDRTGYPVGSYLAVGTIPIVCHVRILGLILCHLWF